MTIMFPAGDYYTCTDGDELSYETPGEAISGYLEGWLDPKSDILAVIRERCPLTVTAYKRQTVDQPFVQSVVLRCADMFAEEWDAEFSGPEGDTQLEPEAVQRAADELLPVVERLYATGTVWNCDPCGHVELNAEQVEAILRIEVPEWLEVADGTR